MKPGPVTTALVLRSRRVLRRPLAWTIARRLGVGMPIARLLAGAAFIGLAALRRLRKARTQIRSAIARRR